MARTSPAVGEVWFAELGMVEKSRPVLVLAPDEPRNARALVIVAPLTSQIRHERGEVYLGKPRWLPKESAVNVQGLASFDERKLTRRLGTLTTEQMTAVKAALRDLLGL
ncbi:MAG: type II toxin-antitoxin system PemK/MazF family toxin [Verrucomicrobiaceae bacterium]|nr:type II toxin-antitoxin system PemK/MazF family toxin [Verrucomicrobiaceae bacterium]